MKIFTGTIALLATLTVTSAFAAASPTLQDLVIENSEVQAVYTLLNLANQSSCVSPKAPDVRTFCFGALPEVNEPTIAATGCGFNLTISCANGASAKISGSNRSYEIVDKNHKVSSFTPVGIIIGNVDLKLPQK